MRTTIELDDDVLNLAREIARRQNSSLGQTISTLARQSLSAKHKPEIRNGVRVFPLSSNIEKPDLQLVNSLRDQE